MTYTELKTIVADGAAVRFRARLQPAGGPGDKVFPPTYEGGTYAIEDRRIGDDTVSCVHLDSVQSQANRMEQALLEAVREKRIKLPLLEVRFPTDDPLLRQVGTITHLDAPHRIADAILRDSTIGDTRFRESEIGSVLDTASLANATGVFQYAPTSLLFGMWDSTGPLGGMGAKFPRAISSEVVGIGAVFGVKSSSRIDPLGIQKKAGPVFQKNQTTGEWTLDESEASGIKAKKASKGLNPSDINHGNIPPSVKPENGGVTFSYAELISVLSMPMLRRLRFPTTSGDDEDQNRAARTLLASLGILGVTLMVSKGLDLRTRTLLIPENRPVWESIMIDGERKTHDVSVDVAVQLYSDAVENAMKAGLPYHLDPVELKPSKGLVELVRRSREITIKNEAE